MKNLVLFLFVLVACINIPVLATQNEIPALDHVFLIMMENHDFDEPGKQPQIITNNADAPFINTMAKKFSLATNYLAIGHPSLTNYLEVVGGSNFATNNDLTPNWGSKVNTVSAYGMIPKTGTEIASSSCLDSGACNNRKLGYEIPGGETFVGMTIADQLIAVGKTWKTYQESLPISSPGGFKVNASDGTSINSTSAEQLYAVKHNPFEYFKSTQGSKAIVGYSSDLASKTISGQLAEDLTAGTVANFNFIAPSQRHDMHGTHQFSEPHRIIQDGDIEVEILVSAITNSTIWKTGKNAIIVMWDENDYTTTGNNKVPVIIETNYGAKGVHSAQAYNHFSLLKTLESGFRLHYLNHASDTKIYTMSDIFVMP